ncbi:lysophospholipid acyltransferase family protein [Alkalicoccus luteus]|uniref:Glycerol acyltransferase n=1 Tax=Alkalicoccus luteus TaxID=1237094 RepID=A0A969PSQ3_9BACI|nr:lysophospholipid acyltransferase family protein [Alkalicoccus luteus]NJP38820.1 glycerol acyltransferase [Alkalicoccus luteus]
MIEAARSPMFIRVFDKYNAWLIKRHFKKVYVSRSSVPLPDKPSILIVNHSSWWDPLFLFYYNERLWKRNSLAMMDEEGLNRYPFFAKLGAFSIGKRARSIHTSLQYAEQQLRNGNDIFLFPQGGENPLEEPFSFFTGAGHLKHAVPEAPVVPVCFYHGFRHHQLPEWSMITGNPVHGAPSWNRRRWTDEMEQSMEETRSTLRREWNGSEKPFTIVTKGRAGIGESWENLKRRTGRLT